MERRFNPAEVKMTVFLMMKREPKYTGIGGYLNSDNRNDVTDAQLLIAVEHLGLTYSDLFLWCNSRNARHFMDNAPLEVRLFVEEIKASLPALRNEVQK
jgi:hypothetical protein